MGQEHRFLKWAKKTCGNEFYSHYFPFSLLVCVPDSILQTWKAVVMNFIWQHTEPKPNSSVLLRPPTMGNLTGLEEGDIITELSWNKKLSWRMFSICWQNHICRLIQNENVVRKFLRWLLPKKRRLRTKTNWSHLFIQPSFIYKDKLEKLLSLRLAPFTILVKNKEFLLQSNV